LSEAKDLFATESQRFFAKFTLERSEGLRMTKSASVTYLLTSISSKQVGVPFIRRGRQIPVAVRIQTPSKGSSSPMDTFEILATTGNDCFANGF
jgi:hypothetical protein